MDLKLDLSLNNKEELRTDSAIQKGNPDRVLKKSNPRIGFPKGKIRIFGHFVHSIFILLALVEASVFLGIGYMVAAQLGIATSGANPFVQIWHNILLISLIFTLSMSVMNLYYSRQRERFAGILVRLVVAYLVSIAAILLIHKAFPILFLGHEEELKWVVVLAFFAIAILRAVFYQFIDGKALKRRVLVLGADEKANTIAELRRKSDCRGFEVAGFLPVAGNGIPQVLENRLLTVQSSICDYAKENNLDEIVVALDDRRQQLPMDDLLDCRMSGIEVTEVLDFFEREAGNIRVDLVSPNWFIHSDGFRLHYFRTLSKRLFDIIASSIILVVTLPICVITALAIWLENGCGGPIFYSQERVGEGGTTFNVLKFRSMVTDAEKDGKAQWAVKNDARITRVGSVIRKYRIDEVPQVINVLFGDMSLVGPRPERPEFVKELSGLIPFYGERHRVKPGITGWAQTCYTYGSSHKDSVEKLQYDLYYVKNHTLLLDISVLMQTVEVVLFGRGAR